MIWILAPSHVEGELYAEWQQLSKGTFMVVTRAFQIMSLPANAEIRAVDIGECIEEDSALADLLSTKFTNVHHYDSFEP